ncbi:MAG: aldo/keto reductase [Thermacetogeniaceae bacterium]|jgi:predicted aldo/keto reductase-like oxidoreductase|nr:aldo/keto reductase [Syntrophomonadaceae bacterium]
MEYRRLGKTELKVSVIGFGGIPVQRIDAASAEKVVNRAIELGINFFDTARGYTDSEEKLGAVLKKHRDKVIIATKSMARDKKGMAEEIDKSLMTMGMDYIDLYQLHNVKDKGTLEQVLGADGALAALKEAKEKGKIRHIGVTGHIKAILLEILKTGEIETVQFPFNPVEIDGAQDVFELAQKMDAGVIVMKPMAGGALTNANLTLRYILEHPVSVAIPGMDSLEQVEENATVGNEPRALTDQEREELARSVEKLGTSFCRRCEYCLPCQQGIDIPSVFLFDGYYTRYDLKDWAKGRYQAMEVKADSCLECGECEERCPYNLPIREMLKEAAERLGK